MLALDDSHHVDLHPSGPQLTHLVDFKGNLLVDEVCRFESLENDINIVLENLGVEGRVPSLNMNTIEAVVPTKKEISLIQMYYESDFDAFGYNRNGSEVGWKFNNLKQYLEVGKTLERCGGESFDPWQV